MLFMILIIFCTSEILKNYTCTCNTILRQHNIDLVLYLPTQIKMDIVYRNPVLNASLQDFLCTNMNNHLICIEKTISKLSKAKIPYTRIPSFKYTYLTTKKVLMRSIRADAKTILFFVIIRYSVPL